MPTPEQMQGVCEIVHAALSRNYDDLTIEQVEDIIDLRNAGAVIQAVMGQSGLTQSKDAAPGEAPAGN